MPPWILNPRGVSSDSFCFHPRSPQLAEEGAVPAGAEGGSFPWRATTARGAASPGPTALSYSCQNSGPTPPTCDWGPPAAAGKTQRSFGPEGGARRFNSDSYQIFSALAVSALPGFSVVQNPILAMMG